MFSYIEHFIHAKFDCTIVPREDNIILDCAGFSFLF